MSEKPTTVLIVDDSAFIRVLLTQILDSDDGIKVVGTAKTPSMLVKKLKNITRMLLR